MRRHLQEVAWFVLFGCLLAGFSLTVWNASRFQHQTKIPTHTIRATALAPQKNEKTEADKPFWEKTTTDPVAYFTLWLVAFTGVLAVSTIGLWGATWYIGAKQSREMKIIQRAYISAGPGRIRPFKKRSTATPTGTLF
jgi:hypothetical protein